MHASREVVFVQGIEAAVVKYAEQLPSYSFPTTVCNSLHGFRRLCGSRKVFAGIVLGKHPNPAAVVAGLRGMDEHMWIIYLHPSASAKQRIAALVGGADVCLTDTVEAPELAAALQALVRRGRRYGGRSVGQHGALVAATGDGWATSARRSASGTQRLTKQPTNSYAERGRGNNARAPIEIGIADVTDAFARRSLSDRHSSHSSWHLTHGGRKLCCRHGLCVSLTPSERIFIACLLDSPGRPVHRAQVADLGNRDLREVASVDGGQRSVDVMVSRLRHKAARDGLVLPIRAVRGWGYMFVTDADAVPGAWACSLERDTQAPAPCCALGQRAHEAKA